MDIVDNHAGEVYISYHSTSNIERRDYAGNFLGNIVEPGVVNYVQQIEIEEPGVILAGVFDNSSSNMNGLYRFDEFNGSIIDYWSLGDVKGVAKLGNGEILYTTFLGGVLRLDPATGSTSVVNGNTSQFFGRIKMDGCIAPPMPEGEAEQAFVAGMTLADIVVEPSDVSWYATEAAALINTNRLPIDTPLVDKETYFAVNIDDGCLSDPLAVTVSSTVGTASVNEIDFSYYPNPTSGKLTFNAANIITEIHVMNFLGQKILELRPETVSTKLDLTAFSKGIYLVNIKTKETEKTVRVIKE